MLQPLQQRPLDLAHALAVLRAARPEAAPFLERRRVEDFVALNVDFSRKTRISRSER